MAAEHAAGPAAMERQGRRHFFSFVCRALYAAETPHCAMPAYGRKLGKWLLFFTPLLSGAAGLIVLEGEPALDSLFQCMCMYITGYRML